tara:strand:- start:425 stop:3028 length:2604 start_codon:yes stop_codon:yes gene_type:complete
MRGVGRALLCVCVFSAAMATETEEKIDIENPHKVCLSCFFDELLENYNEPSTHNCEWYNKYPFGVDTSKAPVSCLTSSQCANQHNELNPFQGTSAPCRRDSSNRNHYITIARLTLPVHLTVKLWGESKATRAWDGDWDGKNGLNFIGEYQNGVMKNVPATNIGASTVDEDDFDRFYTRYSPNPWQNREQWPDAFKYENNVCLGYEQKVRVVTTAGAGASSTQQFNEMTTWWSSCLTSLDYDQLIADEDSDKCETCKTGDDGCLGQRFIADRNENKCRHDTTPGSYDATGITSGCLRNRYSYSFSTCAHIDVCINFNFLKEYGVIEDRMKEAVGSSHVLIFKPKNEDVKLMYYNNVLCAGESQDLFTGTVLDTKIHSVKLEVPSNEDGWTCECKEGEHSWDIERESGLRKCIICIRDTSPALYVDDDASIQDCFAKTMCKACPPDQIHDGFGCVPCPVKTPQRENWVLSPYANEDWKQCQECADFNWYVPGQRCQPVEEMQLRSTADGQVFVENFDHYQRDINDDTTSGFEEVPMNYYRVNTTDNRYDKKKCFDASCSPSATFSFRQWCGAHAISVLDVDADVPRRDVYVTRTVDGEKQVRLWSDVIGTADSWQIERKGKCTPCEECLPEESDWGRYNDGCGIDLVNHGTCQECMNPTLIGCPAGVDCKFCGADQAVIHNRTEGCNDGRAISDYECTNCKFAEVNADQSTVHLLIGCGLQDSVKLWDLDSQKADELTCTFDAKGASACHDTFKQPRKHEEFKDKFWLHPYGTRFPYCPQYYHFDTSQSGCDLENIANVAWRSSCCKICAPLRDGYRKTAGYRTCPGWTIEDTQADHMTADCGAQSYTVENAEGESTCVPCTTCNGESL